MFWLILGKENDVYPLTATLSVNALDPHPPNVNLTLTVQWVGMDGFPYFMGLEILKIYFLDP